MIPNLTLRAVVWLAACALLVAAAPALAKEESKIRLVLDNVSEGVDPDAKGWVRVQLDAKRTVLHLKVSRLEPLTEYVVTFNDEEFARVTTGAKGGTSQKFDLRTDGASGLPMDPRGKLLAVNDGAMDILAGMVSGPLEPSWTLVKEWTQLAPEPDVTGKAYARFQRLPNGNKHFVVMLRGVEPDVYAVLLDGAPLGEIETNSAGNGQLAMRALHEKAMAALARARAKSKGKGPAFQPLVEDPRYRLIEVLREGVLVFSGPMLAQIPGLNVCAPDLDEVALTGASGEGTLRFGVGEDCGPVMEIEVTGLAAGDHDVQVNGSSVGTLSVAADGTGALTLGLELVSGDVVEIVDPATLLVELSAVVP